MEYLEFRQKLSQEIIYNIETFIVMTSLPVKKDTVSVPKKNMCQKGCSYSTLKSFMLHISWSTQNTKLTFLNVPASTQNGAFL